MSEVPVSNNTSKINRITRMWVERDAWVLTKNIDDKERAWKKESILFFVCVHPYDVYELPDGSKIPVSPENAERVLFEWMVFARKQHEAENAERVLFEWMVARKQHEAKYEHRSSQESLNNGLLIFLLVILLFILMFLV